MDAYTIYAQWCKDHNRPAPTRAWWDAACSRSDKSHPLTEAEKDNREIERGKREDWYGR